VLSSAAKDDQARKLVKAGALPEAESPATPTTSVAMLRARSNDWFHRMQMEAIGIRRRVEPTDKADRSRRSR